MRRASLSFYLGLLLVSLSVAYLTWVEEPSKPGGRVPVLRCKKGDIHSLTYETKDRTVRFSKKKTRYSEALPWWVEIKQMTASSPSATEEAAPAGGAAPDQATEAFEVFKANEKLQEVIDTFCPWEALRSLGALGGEKRDEFGLTDTAESLLLELGSAVRSFQLGAATFGPKDRYVADRETGEVFLVSGQSLRDLLQPKSRFMERSLHSFGTQDVLRVKVRAGQREKELVHTLPEEGKEEGWADSRSPDEPKDLYRNWIRKLFTLRATDYQPPTPGSATEGCAAPPGCTQEMSLTFFGEKQEIGFLALYKGADEKGDAAYRACTEHTEIVVEVPKSQAETILKDMEDVLPD